MTRKSSSTIAKKTHKKKDVESREYQPDGVKANSHRTKKTPPTLFKNGNTRKRRPPATDVYKAALDTQNINGRLLLLRQSSAKQSIFETHPMAYLSPSSTRSLALSSLQEERFAPHMFDGVPYTEQDIDIKKEEQGSTEEPCSFIPTYL